LSIALYQRFVENAGIIVPGYVLGVSVTEHDAIVSQIEIVPEEERSEIERELRSRNLNGRIIFLDE